MPPAAQGLHGLWPVLGADTPPSSWEATPPRPFLHARASHPADGETGPGAAGTRPWNSAGGRAHPKKQYRRAAGADSRRVRPQPQAGRLFCPLHLQRWGSASPTRRLKMPRLLPGPGDPGSSEGRPRDSVFRSSGVPFGAPRLHPPRAPLSFPAINPTPPRPAPATRGRQSPGAEGSAPPSAAASPGNKRAGSALPSAVEGCPRSPGLKCPRSSRRRRLHFLCPAQPAG